MKWVTQTNKSNVKNDSSAIKQHTFSSKDPWNWKFPTRSDTMSQSTLDEDRDQVKVKSIKKLKTSRNTSMNLLSHDINHGLRSVHKVKLSTMQPRTPVSLKSVEDNKAVVFKQRAKRSESVEDFSTLNCADIEGAQPSNLTRNAVTKSYSSLRNDDIDGSRPKVYYDKPSRESCSLNTRDINGANTFKFHERF